MPEEVILVDSHDKEIGSAEKTDAHVKGLLHRAFSVFVFNSKGEMLLQQRARNKYHSGGLWSNTCCSHPKPGESVDDASKRRLQEEMGFTCKLKKVFHFIYKSALDKGMTEHELDHVFIGKFEGTVQPNSDEVHSYRWVTIERLLQDLIESPDNYTIWFKLALQETLQHTRQLDALQISLPGTQV